MINEAGLILTGNNIHQISDNSPIFFATLSIFYAHVTVNIVFSLTI